MFNENIIFSKIGLRYPYKFIYQSKLTVLIIFKEHICFNIYV